MVLEGACQHFCDVLGHVSWFQLLGSLAAIFVVLFATSSGFRKRILGKLIQAAKVIPGASGIVAHEKAKALKKMENAFNKHSDKPAEKKDALIPKEGIPKDTLLAALKEMKRKDCDWKGGKAFGFVYLGDDEHTDLMDKTYALFSHSNPLHTSAFPSVQRMEAEVVRMTANMLHGDENVAGTMTSGGTESLLLAVKTYRDRARAEKGITEPEIVLPVSAHAALQKAGHYFGVKMINVPVRGDMRADVSAMRKAITKNTIAIVGSAPGYPHGVIDPISELAALAKEKDIGLHVDGCLGGFMIPWLEKLGYPIPPFDFRVDGVTSISADVHKYGYSAKGASIILYKTKKLCMYQFFSYADWSGGLYGSPSIPGSRPGGLVACAWTSMVAMGEKGFMEVADQVMKAAQKIRKGINEIPGISVVGKPDATVHAIQSDELDIFKIGEALSQRGWHIERQQFPSSLHQTITARHIPIVDKFLSDLKDSVEEVRNNPSKFEDGLAPIYGMAAKMPDRSMVEELLNEYFSLLYKL